MRNHFAVAALALSIGPAWGDASHKTLSNGMKVIVKEDHRSPVVVSMVWYKAGSMDESAGNTGVAHVLEHMMFKGTKTVPAGRFSRLIAEAGGRDNAFTGKDYTAYFQQLHKSKLPLALKLEADRMSDLILTKEEFAKEINVVMEERRWRTDDQPHSLVYENLLATAYQSHPYHHPVIGWMDDLMNMQVADAKTWYDRWYAPNNATLVVVGDVQAEEVFALAQKYFGSIKPEQMPQRKPQKEPPQKGMRTVTVKAPAELPYLMMAWHVPVLRDVKEDWEPYALDVLTGVLDGSEAARLNQSLVREQQLASSVGAGYDAAARGPGMFLIDATPVAGKTADDLETAIREEIKKIVAEGITEEELTRVKAQVVADEVFKRDSMFYQAMQIGQLETAGLPYDSMDAIVDKLKQVTAEQVQKVARKYLIDDSLTVATLDPQPLSEKKAAPPAQGARHD
ncbi:MAG: M16 family metallopeptidase [Burkholderiales bacterium]